MTQPGPKWEVESMTFCRSRGKKLTSTRRLQLWVSLIGASRDFCHELFFLVAVSFLDLPLFCKYTKKFHGNRRRVSWDPCRLSESHESRSTIRLIKGRSIGRPRLKKILVCPFSLHSSSKFFSCTNDVQMYRVLI